MVNTVLNSVSKLCFWSDPNHEANVVGNHIGVVCVVASYECSVLWIRGCVYVHVDPVSGDTTVALVLISLSWCFFKLNYLANDCTTSPAWIRTISVMIRWFLSCKFNTIRCFCCDVCMIMNAVCIVMVKIPVCAGATVFYCYLETIFWWCPRCNYLFLYELCSQCKTS
jgi:hypothetical protein